VAVLADLPEADAATWNVEVENEHVYRVGPAGILVHNTCPTPKELFEGGGVAVKKTGGESAATINGKRAHGNYGTALGENYDTKVILPSGKKPDAVNWETREVRELKPYNARAVKRGEKQVEGYRQELQEMTGEDWTSAVDTYQPKKK
jgi:hypothetical protein